MVSLDALHIITAVTVICAVTVAAAAPAASIRGNGPIPKISRGSSTMFITSPVAFARNGVLLSPIAVNNPVIV